MTSGRSSCFCIDGRYSRVIRPEARRPLARGFRGQGGQV